MGNKIIGTILFIFLMVVAVLGMLDYVMQNQYGSDMTFVEFFEMKMNQ